MNHRIISSDSHVVEPPYLWTERMNRKKWGDRIPRLVDEGPHDQWLCDGEGVGVLGGVSQAGKRYSDPESITLDGRFGDVPPGGYDPHAHVKDLDVDGIDLDILYPSIALNMFSIPDPFLIREVFKSYNDWLSDFCSYYPDKLKAIGMIMLDEDIHTGISEIKRCQKLGMVGIMVPTFPRQGESYDNVMYEPLWATAEDLDIPVSLHTGTNRPGAQIMRKGRKVVETGSDRINNDFWPRMSISQIILSGVFERFPNLNIVNVEHDLAWIPYFIQRMDTTYRERPTQCPYRFKNSALPSDFMEKNVFHSFQDDGLGVRDRHLIGMSQLLWASDYPHAESTFPESQRILSEILADVPETEKAMIVGSNCASLYGLDKKALLN